MNKNTLIHAIAGESCIAFQTFSRNGKSPHWFYILRDRLVDLKPGKEITVHDIQSFAILRLDSLGEMLEIQFTWLGGDGFHVSGHIETVAVPYRKLKKFIHGSMAESGQNKWRFLSIGGSGKQPKLVFHSQKNLHAALGNRLIRHKLVQCLCSQFQWPHSDRIEFFDDCFIPYSFVFRETRNGNPAITGGLVLHKQEDIEKSYYFIHT